MWCPVYVIFCKRTLTKDLIFYYRKEAVPLVDAFDHKDELLCSVAGRYDGDVYNHLYQWALKSPRNKSEVLLKVSCHFMPLYVVGPPCVPSASEEAT